MIGVVAVAHGNIGCEMVHAVRRIIEDCPHLTAVAVESNDPPESIREQITAAVHSVDHGDGIIILSDMFGGTPSNISLSLLEQDRVEVVSGFNLPMLIKLAQLPGDANVAETVRFIQQYGQRNIVIASDVLEQTAKG
jgi:PTS system mannose-specific IIA component